MPNWWTSSGSSFLGIVCGPVAVWFSVSLCVAVDEAEVCKNTVWFPGALVPLTVTFWFTVVNMPVVGLDGEDSGIPPGSGVSWPGIWLVVLGFDYKTQTFK